MVQKNLQARGIECEILKQGRVALVGPAGQQTMVTEFEVYVGNIADAASDFQIAIQLTAAALRFRKGSKSASLREVVVHTLNDGKRLAVTHVGFI